MCMSQLQNYMMNCYKHTLMNSDDLLDAEITK